jgi:uncharacterized protein YbjT (DUF2867 family)
MQKMILILGATGLLGKPVAHQLKADGFRVRILARVVEKARKMFDETFEIDSGDVTDLTSLEKAMNGCMGVHISVGGPVDQVSAENVAALVSKLGVERITYISGATVCEENGWFPMTAQKLAAERAIRACEVAYTIFCPTWPMEMIPRFARGGKPFMMGKQPKPVHVFAADDLARMVSTAYQKDEAVNKRFFVFGPEAMSLVEAIERYCKVFYPETAKVSVMPLWLAKLMGSLTRNEAMQFAAGLMGYFDKIGEMGDPSEANRILGVPATTLDAWMNARKRS